MSESYYQAQRDEMLAKGKTVTYEDLKAFEKREETYSFFNSVFESLLENVIIDAYRFQAKMALTNQQMVSDYVILTWLEAIPFTVTVRARLANRARIESDFFTVTDLIDNGFGAFYVDAELVRKATMKYE